MRQPKPTFPDGVDWNPLLSGRNLKQGNGAASRPLTVVWSVLLTVSISLHFVALGDRAMSHDESIHAHLSWELSENGDYSHDPMYHGPLLYHFNAITYSLLGATDSTARLGPALAGILLLLAIYPMRRYLGDAGAFCAALLVAISPSLLFYGRYLRNDIYMALFATLWVFGALRYLEGRRARWLVLLTAAMALSFAAKETAFITGFSIGSFLVVWAAARIRRGVETWRESAAGELSMMMLLIVLPFLSPLIHLSLGWDPLDYASPAAWRRAALAASIWVALSLTIAWALWRGRGRKASASGLGLTFGRWLSLFSLFWGTQIIFFTSAFRDAPRGLVSGLVGSLGYWLGQHSVGRGSQPDSYYLILLALYEFLPLLLSVTAGISLLRSRVREKRRQNRKVGSPQAAPWLLFWWSFSGWLAYSLAGEKMPWLTVHIALPMAMLSGWWLGKVIEGVNWRRWPLRRLWAPAILPFLLLHSVSRLLATAPARGFSLEAVTRTTSFFYASGLALVSLIGCGIWLRRNRRPTGSERRLLGLGVVLALVLFTAHASWRLCFRDDELATELMVYAHATPDIKHALSDAQDLARRAGLAGDLPIAYDAESAWPFNWYLRDNSQNFFFGEVPSAQVTTYPVILAGSGSHDRLWPFLGNDYGSRDLTLLWWPIERLTRFTLSDIARVLRDPDATRAAWRYIASRELPESEEIRWPNRRDFQMYVKRDLLARSWSLQTDDDTDLSGGVGATREPLKEVRIEPLGFLAGPFHGELLRMPTQVAIAPDGTRAVADAGNNRVVLFSRTGSLVAVIGVDCEDREPCEGGALKEPWGVAAMPGGEFAVADTWNGKIRFYDRRGTLLRDFGKLLIDGTPPFPTDRLYGPRTVMFHPPSNSLLVSDTGHHRILALDRMGKTQEIGAPGVLEGYFQEPVGLAVDPANGSVLVADTWNRRIQRLDLNFAPISTWPVPGWRGRSPYNKPFLAIDGRGYVYASDPEAARVLVFDTEGEPLGAMVSAGWRGTPRSIPLGVAVDLENEELLVSDATLGRVWILPLWP